MNNIAKEINYIIDNIDELGLNEKDIKLLIKSVDHIKSYALEKIVEEGIRKKDGIEKKIKAELFRYEDKLHIAEWRLKVEKDKKRQIEEKMDFKYEEFVPPEKVDGISVALQQAVEIRKRAKYNKEKKKAEEAHKIDVETYKEELNKIDNEINKYKKMIANLTVLRDKAKTGGIEEVFQTAKVAYDVSSKQINDIVNICAISMSYGENMEVLRTPNNNTQLFLNFTEKTDSGYLPNYDAIEEFITFIDENASEISEIDPIFKMNDKINENMIKIQDLKNKANNFEKTVNNYEVKKDEYEEQFKNIAEKKQEIKEIEEKIQNKKMPAVTKKKNIFSRIFSNLRRKKEKSNEPSLEELESKLEAAVIELNSFKIEFKNEEEYNANLENIKLENEKTNEIIKELEKEVKEDSERRDELIANLSTKAENLYQNSEYSDVWANADTRTHFKRNPSKYMLGGLYDKYIDSSRKGENGVSPLIALKAMKIILSTQKIHSPEDAKKLGVVITDEEIEEYKGKIDVIANNMISNLSNKIEKDFKEADAEKIR